ncbi:unnamed protein product [Menidia menidia]|uniref:(Atlantic silverside) hypothetical protein n=1 Tax=Menidia menidia TaxID=238744 RepID=A0A8S4BZS3_9TELE|nr:unnamed protein product [Menidia menidia]
MEPAQLQETCGDHNEADGTSWVSVCPRGPCRVQTKQIHKQTVSDPGNAASCSSDYCPKLGSLCQVRVLLKADAGESEGSVSEKKDEEMSVSDVTELVAAPFLRCPDMVLQVPAGDWTTLRLGEGQCDITEACLERMRPGEKCEIQVTPLGNAQEVSSTLPSEGILPLCATVELRAFTQGKESWEMSTSEKWEWVKSHKERGGVRFRSGDVWGAADSYSRALKLLIPLCSLFRQVEKQGEEPDMEGQIDTDAADEKLHIPSVGELRIIKAELHSNMSLCQLKLNQPQRAKTSAAKATQLDPGAAKAWYRLGLACQSLNELDEAKGAFRKLLEMQPDLPAAVKALKDVISKEKQRNAQLGLRLSKMFN